MKKKLLFLGLLGASVATVKPVSMANAAIYGGAFVASTNLGMLVPLIETGVIDPFENPFVRFLVEDVILGAAYRVHYTKDGDGQHLVDTCVYPGMITGLAIDCALVTGLLYGAYRLATQK